MHTPLLLTVAKPPCLLPQHPAASPGLPAAAYPSNCHAYLTALPTSPPCKQPVRPKLHHRMQDTVRKINNLCSCIRWCSFGLTPAPLHASPCYPSPSRAAPSGERHQVSTRHAPLGGLPQCTRHRAWRVRQPLACSQSLPHRATVNPMHLGTECVLNRKRSELLLRKSERIPTVSPPYCFWTYFTVLVVAVCQHCANECGCTGTSCECAVNMLSDMMLLVDIGDRYTDHGNGSCGSGPGSFGK